MPLIRPERLDTPLHALRAVRTLLSDESHWTKSLFARQRDGSGCPPDDPQADCWCLRGALIAVKCRDDFSSITIDKAHTELCKHLPEFTIRTSGDILSGLVDWNDHEATTFSEVKTALDSAIAAHKGD